MVQFQLDRRNGLGKRGPGRAMHGRCASEGRILHAPGSAPIGDVTS